MGKRSDFERKPRDFYPTPIEAVRPLLPHLFPNTYFDEPCAGNGALVEHLESFGHRCLGKSDIEPQADHVEKIDAFDLCKCAGDNYISNPPWDRKILHPLIIHLSDLAPTWLLFDADWIHTQQSAPYMNRLRKIVSVGRVKWIPGSKMTGKDNCAWHLFDKPSSQPTQFHGREQK
jgi:hypothetical protein